MIRLGGGRASDVYDLGHGRVLRRFKGGGDAAREADVMEHARADDYPVPRVLDVQADALILEHVAGRTMAAELRRRPWRVPQLMTMLARLHRRLHEIPAPPALPAAGPGDALLHLDFHPENVILSPRGPFVVDWTNARRGTPPLDVAMTWVIASTSGGMAGRVLVHAYLRHFDRDQISTFLPAAAERRLADPNVTDRERRAIRALVN